MTLPMVNMYNAIASKNGTKKLSTKVPNFDAKPNILALVKKYVGLKKLRAVVVENEGEGEASKTRVRVSSGNAHVSVMYTFSHVCMVNLLCV